MLTRAARKQNRKHLRRYLFAEYSKLTPPWISPATQEQIVHRRHGSTATATPVALRSRPHLALQDRPETRTKSRNLATTIDSYGLHNVQDSIPFDIPVSRPHSEPPSHTHPHNVHESLTSPRRFDPNDVMVIPQYATPVSLEFRSLRKPGIPADLPGIQQNLYACVRVGRLDRAATLVRRITQMFIPTAPQVYDAHQRYLSGCLESLLQAPSPSKLMAMQKWLELDIRARGVPVGSGIIAIMLKAALSTLMGGRLDRTIRRYIRLAQDLGQDTYYNTLASSIFTAAEINKVLRLFPQEFEAPREELSEQDILEMDQAQKAANAEARSTAETSSDPKQFNFQPLPQLKPTEQKGLGLETLQKSLGSLSAEYLDEANHRGDAQAKIERQEKLEQDVLDAALERWRTESEGFEHIRTKAQLKNPPLGAQVYRWVKAMAAQLEKDLEYAEGLEGNPNAVKGDEDYDLMVTAPFLRLMPAEKVCATTIMHFFGTMMNPQLHSEPERDKLPLVRYCEAIGVHLFNESRIEKIQSHYLQTLADLPSLERRRRLAKIMKSKTKTPKMVAMEYAKAVESNVNDELTSWINNHQMASKVGAVTLGTLLKVARFENVVIDSSTGRPTTKYEPVAHHDMVWRKGKRVGIVQVSMDLLDKLKREPVSSYIAKSLPMIVPPRPWTGLRNGAYYKTPESVVRLRDMGSSQKSYLKLADQRGDMKRTYAGLDVISKTPWRVNKDVLRVMMEVWNSGQGFGKIVPDNLDLKMPEKPDTDDRKILNRWHYVCNSVRNEQNANHSQRCYQNFQLEVARAFSNTTFYTPQNCDFRGRAYPISPYFNHTGADHVRSLFMFADGKKLGDTGLFWLKVQLANAYGYDKESLSERVAFAENHLNQIYDSASNPLDGTRWWLEASDPWQCLAACFEVKNALDSPVPTEYISCLPVQQDGSCNGLQHYAALGGDEVGARQVNLAPGDKPADVYTAVAEQVRAMVHTDAENHHPMAKILDGNITRKMVKQPVMTNVYGVTYIGATQQVEKQLREILPEQKSSMDPNLTTHRLSAYVASCIFRALREMFTGAQAIQLWLGECGARISSAVTPEQLTRIRARRDGTAPTPEEEAAKVFRKGQLKGHHKKRIYSPEDTNFKSTIVWTTPLGMPVVQPYREHKTKTIQTHLQSIELATPSGNDPVSKRKQLQAFPPNFIHSLDATHMMLSALKCDEIGLTFGSVHDSFWTHASDIPTLNTVLRDAFVSMHREDIIARLKEEFEARYRNCWHWTSVKLTSPLGRKLAEYFADKKKRSLRKMTTPTRTGNDTFEDLLEEVQRREFLDSDDAEQRRKGEEMVTASSIVEEAVEGDAEECIYSTSEWGRRLGWVSETASVPELRMPQEAEPAADVPATPEATDAVFDAEESDANTEEGSMTSGQEEVKKKRGRKPGKKEEIQDDYTQEDPAHEEVDNAWLDKLASSKKGRGRKSKAGGLKNERVYFWMPISFPKPPPKGNFDVLSLKESRYFFS